MSHYNNIHEIPPQKKIRNSEKPRKGQDPYDGHYTGATRAQLKVEHQKQDIAASLLVIPDNIRICCDLPQIRL